MSGTATVTHLAPEGLPHNPAFTPVVVVSGPASTVYVGGLNAVDASGAVVGKGSLARQTEQVFANLRRALAAAGARLEDVIKWTILVVQGHALQEGFAVFQNVWGDRPNPPAITVALVAGLANPEFLVELEAIAVVG